MQHRFIITLGLVVACAACSQQHEGHGPSTGSTPPPATASSSPALATTSATPSGLTYLYDLMQRPDFSTAFAALSGADQLPAWAKQGGVATPAQQVVVDGHTQLLATACKPHDCPSERILILYDESTHAMSGLFARRKPNAANDADSNDPANDDLIWLGAPDEASKQLLQHKLYSPD
ncbi:Ivy family c-type lysozyme inhibitor [Dyella japonica]|uniref:Ivy family c-type lysozyme inhibitor n=1 Tax=Dyella japonica TaxID=231455 RepID=UPI0003147423|nr:Ivy family c-type lysozyme inhibitor [Dyella japonica]